jgi:hypothetical protein
MLEANRWDCDQVLVFCTTGCVFARMCRHRVVAVRFNTFGDTLSGSGYSARSSPHALNRG